ncbi:hypothetical protein PAK39_14260 [Proteus mirabilis]|uniref:hypothetical protein n=1 Tax=Proteus mirabilis TaxID=584 RepID=UPI000D702C60|nr:hypothetical protein [Proteus mirabilis]ELA7632640.1 hypothetical protein [Proteus mirabilis]MBS3857579.1 hypothetical protein [Proteus mirabilis]MDM3557684.1 hypothetical protein [Proteus mirabilis]MDM3831685.1 hypothetical protein [Proteus mirabilis]RYH16909.1 hypothetical protein EVY58_10235 [Proteus mirabilis]
MEKIKNKLIKALFIITIGLISQNKPLIEITIINNDIKFYNIETSKKNKIIKEIDNHFILKSNMANFNSHIKKKYK